MDANHRGLVGQTGFLAFTDKHPLRYAVEYASFFHQAKLINFNVHNHDGIERLVNYDEWFMAHIRFMVVGSIHGLSPQLLKTIKL
jgi:hypothetical protein